jgi:hypothetical protein
MPGRRFTVQLNPDDLAMSDFAAALGRPAGDTADRKDTPGAEHHGARDSREAARQRSGRDRAGRAAGAGTGRSYAFRRS